MIARWSALEVRTKRGFLPDRLRPEPQIDVISSRPEEWSQQIAGWFSEELEMSGDVSISKTRAGRGDAERIAELVHQLLVELSGGKGPSLGDLALTAEKLLRGGLVHSLIAMVNERPVGVVCLSECAAIYAGGQFGVITELYVMPEYRSQGLASRLIEEAKQIGRERGWPRLEVGAPSQPAWNRTLQFYLREDFQEVGPRLKILL